MPLYAYRCTKCGHRFEKIQHFSDKEEQECPKCHGVLERPLTAPTLNFKGAGWYVNDYAPKSSEPASESESEASSKPETESTATEIKNPSTASESATSAPTAAPAAAPAATSDSTS